MRTFHQVDATRSPAASRSGLSRLIKDRAFELGFHKAAIVAARELNEEGKRLKEWLACGYHGEMKWMERDVHKRLDPSQLLANARSIVVVALNYYTPHKHKDQSTTGKVSRYAWGDDYHDVVGQKLHSLLGWLREQRAEINGKVCVDIQPIMDKAWAVRAGLGWIGKHSNLITPDYGSWVFIGELILDTELEYDVSRIEDHCGTCTMCLDACPTQAIVAPYVVDSNKCISHATIELRDNELPEPVDSQLSGWFYGCDICQDVCPWNRFEQVTDEERFQPREGNVNIQLRDVLELTQESYVTRFRGSAMKRAKLSGLQRNARALLESSE
jgi:epoxyqueuosine reductase